MKDIVECMSFLTISGDSPSDDAYISISYEELADIIQNALRRRENPTK